MPAVAVPPSTTHLLVPYAHASDPACATELAALALPNLQTLLNALAPQPLDVGQDSDWTPPHERALARLCGLAPAQGPCPDGLLPWAAWATRQHDSACAWFTPCHWQAGMDQVMVLPPESLSLDAADEQALLQALTPFCAEDGIDLRWHSPGRWLAKGDVFDGLRSASLDRVSHRRPDAWLPDGQAQPAARLLLRLMNEAQMLFYTHPVSDRRLEQGLPPVNGLWISGAGRTAPQAPGAGLSAPTVWDALQPHALQGDWRRWGQAWLELDAALAPWVERLAAGQPVRLTLCGERHAQTWGPSRSAPPAPWTRWWNTWRTRRATQPAWYTALSTL